MNGLKLERRMNKRLSLVVAFSICANMIFAQTSPNGKISVSRINGKGLSVEYSGSQLFTVNIKGVGKASKSVKVNENYDMKVGKRLHCENEGQECTYSIAGGKKLIVRAYNDGVVWRTKGGDISGVSMDMSSARNSWLQKWTEPYEWFYDMNTEEAEGKRWAYPSLFEYDNNAFVLISESDIQTYNSASCLYSTSEKGIFNVVPDKNEVKCPQSPWHVAIIGSLNDVVQSTLVTDVASPCRLENTSWIQPGVASWVYWAYNHGSNDCNIINKYTDMAVELHLPYVLIDAEWDEMKDGKKMEDAVRYAVDKGIKPMIWYNSSVGWINGAPGPKFRLNKKEDREKEFAYISSIGVVGVKIDFFSGDNQMNQEYMIQLLESAAKYNLCVNFHGATLPRGWQRTYPNLVSTEAVYGAEWYNNVPTFTAKAARHNATLPFTRNVIGSMDYTPCAFTDSQHPHITTHAHELALTALYESGIQHLADRPESFLAQPEAVKAYLGNLPTAWDETLLLDGYPGDYVVMARRKGNVWYVAGINGTDEEKEIPVSLSRISGSKKNICLYCDGTDKEHLWDIRYYTDEAVAPTSLRCKARGGFLAVIANDQFKNIYPTILR